MPIVRMPDGQKIRFPDNMSREEIRGMILQKFPDAFERQKQQYNGLRQGLRPLTESQKAEAAGLAAGLRPQGFGALDIAKEGVKGFGQGVVSGLGRVAGGATLGATDWLDRKMGSHLASLDADLQRSAESAGLGGWNKAAKFASELGGNMQGAGGALVKGLSKAGLKGLKLASASGGLEGAAYGATGSDSMDELPENVAWGAAFGAALPFGIHGIGRSAKGLRRVFTSTPPAVKTAAKLEKDIAQNTGNKQYAKDVFDKALQDAERGGKSIIEVAEAPIVDVAQGIRQKTPRAGYALQSTLEAAKERQPQELRSFIDNVLGSQTRGASIAEVADRAQREVAPIYKRLENLGDLEIYEIAGKLKKMPMAEREFLGEISPEKAAQILQEKAKKINMGLYLDGKDGIEHFVKDSQRRGMANTLADTFMDADISAKGFSPEGIPTNYFMKKYLWDVNKNKPIYDLVMQRKAGEIFNKFPKTDVRGVAKNFKAPLDNLSVKDPFLSDMGISPSGGSNNSLSKIGSLVNDNSVLANAVSRVKKAHSSLKDLPDTDFRVINEARRALNEQSKSYSDFSGYEARSVLKELDPVLDEIVPDYKLARGIYSDAHKFEDAAGMSKDVFTNSKNPSDFAADVAKLGQHEKAALAIGLRDDLLGRIGSRENEALGFTAIMPQNVQDKMRIALGNDKANAVIDKAKQAIRLNQNYNQLLKGSQTAEKQTLRDKSNMVMRILKNPTGIIGEVVAPVERYFTDRNNVKLADLLTNPNVTELRKGLNAYRSLGSPININPLLSAGLSSAAYNNLRNR